MTWDECQALDRAGLGRLGEEMAVAFLADRDIPILSRNLRIAEGEIDIVARINRHKTLVEVRSIRSRAGSQWPPRHPLAAFGFEKARQVRRVATGARCRRVDLITVRFHPDGVDIHWVPRVI